MREFIQIVVKLITLKVITDSPIIGRSRQLYKLRVIYADSKLTVWSYAENRLSWRVRYKKIDN